MPHFQNSFGQGFKTETHLIFFGGVGSSTENLKTHFPELQFLRVKQIHSSLVVEAAPLPVDADAHFTDRLNTALVIATADCIPMMIFCRQTNRVAAIHAGWRGVVGKIAQNTLQKLIESGSSKRDFEFYIGPHIMQNSFEISEDVYSVISEAQPLVPDASYAKDDKFYVNLKMLINLQVEEIMQKKVFIKATRRSCFIVKDYFNIFF